MSLPETPSPESIPPAGSLVPVVLRTKVKKATITFVLMGLCVILFLGQFLSKTYFQGADILFALGGKINEYILMGQVWRLITPMLLHGNWLHLGFNMYALYIIGRFLERFYGHGRFFALFVIAGFCGNALSFLLSSYPSLGASTAIFGLVAAQGVLIFRNKRLFGKNAQSMLINLALVLLVNLSLGISPNSGIDNWGHLGGLLGGAAFAWMAGPLYHVLPRAEGGFEMKDSVSAEQLLWGVLLSAGLFTAVVIGKFVAG